MFRRLAIGLAVAALIALPAGQSSAGDKKDDDGFIGVGANFTWDNYKTPILRYTGTDISPGLSSLDYGGPNFGGAFHWGINKKLVLSAALDFGFFSHKVYPYPASGADNVAAVTANFWQLGVMLGVKYFFKEPEAGKVSLYLSAGIGKYFAGSGNNAKAKSNQNNIRSAFYDEDDCSTYPESCDGDTKLEGSDLDDAWEDFTDGNDAWEDAVDDDADAQKAIDAELEMVGDLAAPFVAQIAIGAEFFATDTFSIGADILGLRFSFASTDVGKVSGTDLDSGAWTGEQKYVNLYIYSGLTMNFNLTGGEETPAKAEEEAPADDGWGTPASSGGQNDGWGTGGGGGQNDGWGGGGGWSTGPAAPTPAPATTPAPAPAPATTPAAPPAPAPVPGQPGGDIPPPPPPPPPA